MVEEGEYRYDNASTSDSTSESVCVSEREVDRLLSEREKDIIRSRDEHYYSTMNDTDK